MIDHDARLAIKRMAQYEQRYRRTRRKRHLVTFLLLVAGGIAFALAMLGMIGRMGL
jgi:hypothetical protein